MQLKNTVVTIFIAALVLLLTNVAAAEDVNVSGTWKAKTVSPRGTAEQTITFKQTRKTFTGEMITSQGVKEPIKDGKVSGEDIEFNVERKQPSGDIAPVPYKGKVKGDEITGTFTGASGREIDWTATRESGSK